MEQKNRTNGGDRGGCWLQDDEPHEQKKTENEGFVKRGEGTLVMKGNVHHLKSHCGVAEGRKGNLDLK